MVVPAEAENVPAILLCSVQAPSVPIWLTETRHRRLGRVRDLAWGEHPARCWLRRGCALAHELRGFEKLSVTTPGINTMQELAESEGIEVVCLGGRLRRVSQSFVEPVAEATLGRMSFWRSGLFFPGVDGPSPCLHKDTDLDRRD